MKRLLRPLSLVALLLTVPSFDIPPAAISPFASGAPVVLDVPDEDPVKRFMEAASDSALTILNGNLWMLPGGLSVDKEARIDRFVAYARRLMPDVITLQEVWTTDLVAYLKTRFPEFDVVASGRGGLFNRGGLVTLTRMPVDSSAFTPFESHTAASLAEQQAGKGYLIVRLRTPFFRACVVNTHLYAPFLAHEQALVEQQFETLKRAGQAGYYFIVGDLNLARPAFERLNGSFFVTEDDSSHTIDPANPYRRRGTNTHSPRNTERGKIDRLLMPRAFAAAFTLRAMLIREPVVSDHYLLAYRVEHP